VRGAARDKQSEWYYLFSCVPERRTPYLLSTALIPFISVSVLMSDRWEEWEEVRVTMLKNFKGI
jgi:hypothetical protein